MRFQKINKSLGIVTLMMMFILVGYGQVTITVYDNFGLGHDGFDYNYQTGWTIAGEDVAAQYGVEQAMQFQSDYDGVVSDIWVAILKVPSSAAPDTVTIRLTENPSGQPPTEADIMEEWTLTSFSGWSQWSMPHHLEGNGTSQLLEGHTYWLWAIAEETTWCMWALNEDPSLTCPHTIRREDEDWLPIGNETAGAFRVDVNLGTVGMESVARITDGASLSQNFPNPFNQTTNISYSIEKTNSMRLTVYDIYGKEVQLLVNEFQESGNYSINFDPSFLSTGIYFYKLQAGNQLVDIKKMSYLK